MIECTSELIESVKPMYYKVIKDTMKYYDNSDVEYSMEDLIQECVIFTMEACRKYDETREAKFTSFLMMLLYSRLGSLRNSINNKRFKYGTTLNFTSLMFEDSEKQSKESFEEFYNIDDSVENHIESLVHGKIEAERIYKFLKKENRKEIYLKYFIEGKTIAEIVKDFNNTVTLVKVRNEIKLLKQIHNTLVEDSTCLN